MPVNMLMYLERWSSESGKESVTSFFGGILRSTSGESFVLRSITRFRNAFVLLRNILSTLPSDKEKASLKGFAVFAVKRSGYSQWNIDHSSSRSF